MLNSGTLTDKVAAMASLIQNDPVHNVDLLEEMLAMANKKGKREAQLAINSLRELFTLWILPDLSSPWRRKASTTASSCCSISSTF